MEKMAGLLPKSTAGEVMQLWLEYEGGKTREAIAVKDFDKLEMALQAMEYEKHGSHSRALWGFFVHCRKAVKTLKARELLDSIVEMRKNGKASANI